MKNLHKSSIKFGKKQFSLLQAITLSILLYDLKLIGHNIGQTVYLMPIYVFFGFIVFIFGLWTLIAMLMLITGNSHKIKFTYTKPFKK